MTAAEQHFNKLVKLAEEYFKLSDNGSYYFHNDEEAKELAEELNFLPYLSHAESENMILELESELNIDDVYKIQELCEKYDEIMLTAIRHGQLTKGTFKQKLHQYISYIKMALRTSTCAADRFLNRTMFNQAAFDAIPQTF